MASSTATLSTTQKENRRTSDHPNAKFLRSALWLSCGLWTRCRLRLAGLATFKGHVPSLGDAFTRRPFRWKCCPQWVNRFETRSPLHPCWKKISHHHELRLPNG